MQISASAIAKILDGIVVGDPETKVDRPSKIEEGGAGTITFLANPKYEPFAYTTTASILLVGHDFEPKQPIAATLVKVENVYNAITVLLEKFGNQAAPQAVVISEKALIHPTARLGQNTAVGAFSVIEEGATIGEDTQIGAQVYIGKNVEIGSHTIICPGAKILHACKIGDYCVIHPNVVIGSDGFGFVPQADGSYKKIPQTGNVIIEDRVEIGAGTTIDRATMGATIIHAGVKLDNLIQIGHNVEIGENTVIAAQAGVAGSTKIGKNCRIGGQVGFVGHLRIADGTQIQAQSGVASNVTEPDTALFGYPAIRYNDYVKSYVIFKKLPELYKLILKLEKQLKESKDTIK